MKDEQFYMQHAIDLAKLTVGQTRPNPSVGAVVVKDGVVIGTGTHLQPGQPHAEVYALQQAQEQANGATMFVTLEPCSHYGKTPPCAKAIIDYGIKKVYVATLDPNPKVAGKGIQWLIDEGIEVEVGLLEEQAQDINQKFFHFMKHKRPFVTLKTAVSMDGKTTANSGDSKWITSIESRHDVHVYRHQHESILVGSKTVLRDDPQLTTRLPHGGLNPTRIVLDTNLSIPLDANLLTNDQAETIVVCAKQADYKKEEKISSIDHVKVWRMDTERIDLVELLHRLKEGKIMSVYVEGGSTIHSEFIQKELFDEIHLYMAPKLIGGEFSKAFYNQLGFDQVEDSVQVDFKNVEMLGPDLKITARPQEKEVD
ncbi:bifunctional diaminohydroxyphosphoribosylaminopyrimidine deaminase/5-amino-6-(5-phosphoribosylamino)uracil reductase RibD [Alkalibacillus haloalkaliphilus]|uniref:bifunctional diaminohydroxyphosphoribosylaminopyrimidine deaminase/5-amino-6-(5-phosphoribosylamino)uracil reductase RibD n=1 Tax=Alkalibacillus haloalkaliphilus TaxID=94136 RepID=UPI002935EBD2|nr:bifunctional diaminohydroxyphosphoribosylaminopyrimidine deaminase/5-amino-6-(5-phosphoribosylamino)uracil reductase RibD [Alkalibacillus haloalkaliphilus]MDV2582117.1 bifunctional diaminohydroxyphosphoribosylaminopyrimidine deaminase/5-amino-6-(5-phosphoribosylamino)uracil reductase RibD [Alkalibacillus haloalkaliphilus]